MPNTTAPIPETTDSTTEPQTAETSEAPSETAPTQSSSSSMQTPATPTPTAAQPTAATKSAPESTPETTRPGVWTWVGRSVLRWFDNGDPPAPDPSAYPGPKVVEWVRNLPYFAMHAACLLVIWVGISWTAVAVAVALYYFRMFSITGFYHRYFSHKTFKTSRAFQLVMAICGLCAIQRGPLWWAAHHRHHHVHSDEHADLHSPKQHGMLWSHMFWFTTETVYATNHRNVKDLSKFPEIKFINRYETIVYAGFAAAMLGLGAFLSMFDVLNTSIMQVFVWGFFISTVFNYHAVYTINSLSHIFGRRRYNTTDTSRNNIWLAFLTLGEGWHNNHHHYPSSVKQGFYWWEVDITYYVLKMMSWTGLIWDLRGVPEKKLLGNRIA